MRLLTTLLLTVTLLSGKGASHGSSRTSHVSHASHVSHVVHPKGLTKAPKVKSYKTYKGTITRKETITIVY